MKKILSALLIIGLLVSHLTAFQVNASEVNIDQNLEYDKLQQGNYESTISGQIVKSDPEIVKNSDIPSLYVAADSEKPVIDTSSIWIDNTSVYYGDTVTIRVKVTDNDKLEEVLLNLRNDSSSNLMYYLKMSYNDEIDMYEYTLNINTSISAGIWNIESVSAKDITGNYALEYFNTSFSVINASADSEKPYIDVNSLSISKTLINENESLLIKIRVTDDIEVDRVNILFDNKEASNLSGYKELNYNQNSNYYEYEFIADDKVPSGTWYISSIIAYDKSGNSNYINFNTNDYTFFVNNQLVDSEKPMIDIHSFSITPINAQTNNVVTIQVKITDNTEINRVNILLSNWDTMQNSGYLDMEYDPISGLYKYSFVVDNSITVGHWTVDITAYDLIGNYSYFGSYEGTIFFVTDKGEDIHDWDEGIITKKPTSTEEGIKTYTCKFWACGATKTESIPTNSETDAIGDNANNSGSNNTENGNSNENINNSNNDISSLPSWWQPTTQEEKIRYSCFGKEKLEYTTPDNQPFNINIQNAMQGEKCFEVFQNIAGDYTIARTYNIYPIGTQLQFSTPNKITVSLTIPEILRQKNREFKMICVSQNGIPFIFEDKDKDPDTITFSTDKFYAFALVYKDKN